MNPILTIGHSNHQLSVFAKYLHQHEISTLADIRSVPYSRYCPQFNKDSLGRSLNERSIDYMFLGRELGARVNDPSCYLNGRIVYSRLARRLEFSSGIKKLIECARNERTVLMCSEEDPLTCHRTILVARELDREGISIEHIRGDGRVETHDDVKTRLLKLTGLYQGEGSQLDMFHQQDNDKLLSDAFEIQEEKIAYRTVQPK